MPRQLSVVRRFGNWFNIVWNSILSGVASQPTQPHVFVFVCSFFLSIFVVG